MMPGHDLEQRDHKEGDGAEACPRTAPVAGTTGWLARLASSTDSPARTAAGFALGVFLSFSPLLGLQIVAAIAGAALFRLNRVAVFVGVCTNMPWIMVPYYALMTAAGAAILGAPLEGDVSGQIGAIFERPVYRAAFWQGAVDVLSPFLWSFVLGSFAGATVIALAAYVTARRFVEQVRRNRMEPPPPAGN